MDDRYKTVSCGECGATGVRLWRPYGSFRRPEDDRCLAHVPKEQRGWYVPLVLDVDGDAWGYTSCPEEDIDVWKAMPEAVPGFPRASDANRMFQEFAYGL